MLESILVSITSSILSGGIAAAITTYYLNKRHDKQRDILEADRKTYYKIKALIDDKVLDALKHGDYYAGVYYPTQQKMTRLHHELSSSTGTLFHTIKINSIVNNLNKNLEDLLISTSTVTTKENDLITTKSRTIDFNNLTTMERVKEEARLLEPKQTKTHQYCVEFLRVGKETLRA